MSRLRRTRGFVLITMVASIVVILSIVGLAIDTGHLQLVKVRMQTAADAAVVGGVEELKANLTANVTSAALADAATNGFTDGQNTVTVVVNKPPASGYYTGDSTAVEVTIHQSVNTYFMALAGFGTMDVSARAVARRGPDSNCLYVLDPAMANAFSISGGAIVQVNCGVMINSSSSSALSISGNNTRLYARSVSIVGNYSTGGGALVTPEPYVRAPAEPDPLAAVGPPAVGACTATNFSITNGAVQTIPEGVYCNGISVSGGARLTLTTGGKYILKGGGLTVAGNSTLIGAEVTFYNTYATGYNYGPISLAGGATIHLSAPVSGPLTGMLFFQDRSVTGGTASNIAGGASSFFNGALYFPTTSLTYSGGTGTEYTIIVAKQLTCSGGTTLNNDYSSLPNGPPTKGSAWLGE
jgi:hypothetical protein